MTPTATDRAPAAIRFASTVVYVAICTPPNDPPGAG